MTDFDDFKDGWEDDTDLDLNDISSSHNNNNNNNTTEQAPSGWEEDDDLFDDDSESALQEQVTSSSRKVSTSVPTKQQLASSSKPIVTKQTAVTRQQEGWEEDDELFDETSNATGQPAAKPLTTLNQTTKKTATQGDMGGTLGWEEDEDLFGDDDKDESNNMEVSPLPVAKPKISPPPPRESNTSTSKPTLASSAQKAATTATAVDTGDGWDDDLDFDQHEDLQDETTPEVPPAPHHPPPARKVSKLYTDLEMYLDLLTHLHTSINAVFQAEYNTPDKATELIQYYMERPGLVKYTLEKELPRMEYGLVDGGSIIIDKQRIARRLHQDSSLLPRCANQSLLADMLQVFTGHDMLVRPQYLAAAVAHVCRFRLDLHQCLVQVQAQLDLSLPTQHGRWKIAEIHVEIDFSPNPRQPHVEYHLVNVHPTTRDAIWQQNLRNVAELLESMHLPDESLEEEQEIMGVNFRDVFLQQSQDWFTNSAAGMKSTWQEIESVAGISSKLKRLPGFLPDDVVHAAAQHDTTVPYSPPQRPTSILGGFVRSGLSRLAKTVTLPDEDPSLYQEWQQQQQRQQPRPPAAVPPPRPAAAAAPPRRAPKLYNTETPPSVSKQPPPPPPPPATAPPPHPRVPPPPPPPISAPPKFYREDKPAVREKGPKLHREIKASSPSVEASMSNQAPELPSTKHTMKGNRVVDSSIETTNEFLAPAEPKPSQEEEPMVEDGWDDDILDVEDDLEVSPPPAETEAKPSSSSSSSSSSTSVYRPAELPEDWVYNPDDDIIPTRKRWINPRPGSRRLSSYTVRT